MFNELIKEMSKGDYNIAATAALHNDGSVLTAYGGEQDLADEPFTMMFLGMHIMVDAMLQIVLNNSKAILDEAQKTEESDEL